MATDDRIRELAHKIWESEGKPEGRALVHWEQARQQLENRPPEAVGLLTPIQFLREAIIAVPAVKWALGLGEILSVVAIIVGFGFRPETAVVYENVMIVLMFVLLAFARFSELKGPDLHPFYKTVAYICATLFVLSAVLVFTSVFFNWPRVLL